MNLAVIAALGAVLTVSATRQDDRSDGVVLQGCEGNECDPITLETWDIQELETSDSQGQSGKSSMRLFVLFFLSMNLSELQTSLVTSLPRQLKRVSKLVWNKKENKEQCGFATRKWLVITELSP